MDQNLKTAKQVTEALTQVFPDLPPALQAAARFIIDNPREVGLQSMRSLAAKASDPRRPRLPGAHIPQAATE